MPELFFKSYNHPYFLALMLFFGLFAFKSSPVLLNARLIAFALYKWMNSYLRWH